MVEGKRISSVAREVGISRNTVSKYLTRSELVRKESVPRPRPVMDRVAPRIEEILEEWKHRVTPKQRITGSRILRQLREDHYQVGVTTVRDYLREKRRRTAEVYIPLVYRPGDEGQFDFFEVTVEDRESFVTSGSYSCIFPIASATSCHSTIRVINWRFWTATCGRRRISAVRGGGW